MEYRESQKDMVTGDGHGHREFRSRLFGHRELAPGFRFPLEKVHRFGWWVDIFDSRVSGDRARGQALNKVVNMSNIIRCFIV